MSRIFTEEEQLTRLWDKEEVIKTINRHSYYMSNEMREEELEALWVKDAEHQKTASLGVNTGYYTGMEEIRKFYVDYRKEQRKALLKGYLEKDPSLSEADLGIGSTCMNTATTPLAYISDDGKSAQYQGYRAGMQCKGRADGEADCYMDLGLIHCDLLKEDGEWKIWHLELERDHTFTVAENYAKQEADPAWPDPLAEDFGEPTVKQTVYDPFYGWEYMFQDMPRPYETMTDERSYGPKGQLGKPYYERDPR